MIPLGSIVLAAAALAVPPAQSCPCTSSYDGAKSACTFADPQRELRIRTQMAGPLTVSAKRIWKGQPLPSFIPEKDDELVPFGVRFSGPNKLMFVGGCQQAQAKLFRVDVTGNLTSSASSQCPARSRK